MIARVMRSGVHCGKLTTWKDDRGFGFIQPTDRSQAVFLHISEVRHAARRPRENDTIYYRRVVDANGKVRACDACIAGADVANVKEEAAVTVASDFPIAQVLLLSGFPVASALHFTWTTRNPFPLGFYFVMSIVTYGLYVDDKSRAKRNVWRISEQTLHLCELGGGWMGGWIAQRTIHHKSKKKSYQAVFWTIVTLHYGVWLFWLVVKRTLG